MLKKHRDRHVDTTSLPKPDGGGTVLIHQTFPLVDGVETASALDFGVGARVADTYVVKRTLGAGGMGIVYLAHHEQWDLDVALKVLHPEHVLKPEYREVLTHEAQAWTDSGLHPHDAYCYC